MEILKIALHVLLLCMPELQIIYCIYFSCAGIQQYLFENGRIDNIFADLYYERFTECLTEILAKCQPKFNAAGREDDVKSQTETEWHINSSTTIDRKTCLMECSYYCATLALPSFLYFSHMQFYSLITRILICKEFFFLR